MTSAADAMDETDAPLDDLKSRLVRVDPLLEIWKSIQKQEEKMSHGKEKLVPTGGEQQPGASEKGEKIKRADGL